MTRKRLLITLAALPLAAGLVLASTPAQAQWRRGPGPGFYHRGPGPGPAIVGGALLGLGIGALLAAPYAPPPPVVYAPPPPYYPPAYAYAPPAYYPPPGYYVR